MIDLTIFFSIFLYKRLMFYIKVIYVDRIWMVVDIYIYISLSIDAGNGIFAVAKWTTEDKHVSVWCQMSSV